MEKEIVRVRTEPNKALIKTDANCTVFEMKELKKLRNLGHDNIKLEQAFPGCLELKFGACCKKDEIS